MSMNLPAMFDQNPPHTLDQMVGEQNLRRGSLSNWCDADVDTDADSSKTICRPQPYGG